MVNDKEPGVYVRTEQPADDLDFFWDREPKKSRSNQPFHISIFLTGFVVGSIFTFFLCLLFFSNGKLFGVEEAMGTNEVIIEEKVLSPEDLGGQDPVEQARQEEHGQQESHAKPLSKLFPERAESKTEKEAAETDSKPARAVSGRTYEVQSGDTLGGIAYKFYEDSSPAMVDKIMEANNLPGPDQLQIGQKLVIPPKE